MSEVFICDLTGEPCTNFDYGSGPDCENCPVEDEYSNFTY